MSKECIGYNDITKKFIYRDTETGLITQDSGVLGIDKIEEIKTKFGINEQIFNTKDELTINGTGDRFVNVNSVEYKLSQKDKQISDLEAKLAKSEEINKLANEQLQDMERSKLSWENQYFTLYKTLKNYREVNEKKHLLNENEWQDYCAYKIIEPQIKGCLDREREYEKQLAVKEKEIVYMTKQAKKFNNEAQKYFEDAYCNDSIYQDKISFCIEKLADVRSFVSDATEIKEPDYTKVCNYIDNQIEKLKKEMN